MGCQLGMGIAFDRVDCAHPRVGPRNFKAKGLWSYQPFSHAQSPPDHSFRDRLLRNVIGDGPARYGGHCLGARLSSSQSVPDIRSAMLFSLNAITSYGHANLQLEAHWQLMGAIEALNGWLLFGLSTAFLLSIIERLWQPDSK